MAESMGVLSKKISSRFSDPIQHDFVVYFEDCQGNSYHTVISQECFTVEEAIEDSINNFNTKNQLKLDSDTKLYELYLSKKNGKRNNDLPSLDKKQQLSSIKT